MSEAKTIPTWGYHPKGDQIFELKPGEGLPEGYYAHPAQVPNSAAQKQYIADAEREGAPTPLLDEVKKPATTAQKGK